MTKNRVDRVKVSRGGATQRKHESKGCMKLKEFDLIQGTILDYGCG